MFERRVLLIRVCLKTWGSVLEPRAVERWKEGVMRHSKRGCDQEVLSDVRLQDSIREEKNRMSWGWDISEWQVNAGSWYRSRRGRKEGCR